MPYNAEKFNAERFARAAAETQRLADYKREQDNATQSLLDWMASPAPEPKSEYIGTRQQRGGLRKGDDAVIAWDAGSRKMDRTIIPRETRESIHERMKIVHKERPAPYKIPRRAPRTQEEIDAAEDRHGRQSLLRRLNAEYVEARTLAERLRTPTPPPVAGPSNFTPYVPKSVPQVHVRKHKYIYRVNEFKDLYEATCKRINLLIEKIQNDVAKFNEDGHARLDPDAANRLLDQFAIFERWGDKIPSWEKSKDVEGFRLGQVDWRHFKGACKRIGKTSFEQLDERLEDIVLSLYSLEFPEPYDGTGK